ncbi:hypothetical protein HPB49_000687 [Dermacentor silvarum]|uniref:Uncharacterized protein n=1 Tax=Dermacentor silvarum TaxID=543639 RepID=A0ACB8CU23_DERSI|nr:hypothetical protein HPB49_000687 [Dermacentor silvarum]
MKDTVTGTTEEHDIGSPTTLVPAERSSTSPQQPSVPVHTMRRRRKKKKSKPATTKKRRRGVSLASNTTGYSIIADTATLATEETLSRRPEESPTQEELVARRVSVMSPSSPTEHPSAFNTAQSTLNAFKSAVASPLNKPEAAGCKSRQEVSMPHSPRPTSPGMRTLPVMPEALTIPSVNRSPSERRTPPTMRRSQSRGALTTVTFGRTSLTTLLPDTNTSLPTSPARGLARAAATYYGRRSVASRVITREPSTADAGMVPGALYRAGLQTCALVSLGVLTFHWLAIPLLAPSVDHWCSKPPEAGNLSDVMWRNAAIPVRSDGRFSQCTVYSMVAPVWTTESAVADTSISREERECSSWDYDLAPDVKTMTNEWNLVCDRRKQLLVAVVYNNLGGLVAMPFVGQMADRLGRWYDMSSALCLVALISSISRAVQKAERRACDRTHFRYLQSVNGYRDVTVLAPQSQIYSMTAHDLAWLRVAESNRAVHLRQLFNWALEVLRKIR